MNLPGRFVRHVRERGLLEPGARIVVACSGGADSTALAHLVARSRDALGASRVLVAHLDHGLRAGSAADLVAVREMARVLGVEFAGERRPVVPRALESPEEAARRVRYDFLAEAARESGAGQVVTAHQMDDQAETVLLRVLRGTGPEGLAAIRERRPLAAGVELVRPLLQLRAEELRSWLRFEVGATWREDPTNRDGNDRARLRAQGLPALAACLGRDPVPPLARLAANAADAAPLAPDAIGAAFVHVAPGSVTLHGGFERLPRSTAASALRSALTPLLGGRPPSRDALARLLDAVAGRDGGPVAGLDVERDATETRIVEATPGSPPPAPCALPLPGTADLGARGRLSVEVVPAGNEPFLARLADRAGTTELADAAALVPPLAVRFPRPGDRLRPLGWETEARVGHVLQRRGVPARRRATLPLLCDAEGIVWAVGAALAERVRVRPGTTRIAVLRMTSA